MYLGVRIFQSNSKTPSPKSPGAFHSRFFERPGNVPSMNCVLGLARDDIIKQISRVLFLKSPIRGRYTYCATGIRRSLYAYYTAWSEVSRPRRGASSALEVMFSLPASPSFLSFLHISFDAISLAAREVAEEEAGRQQREPGPGVISVVRKEIRLAAPPSSVPDSDNGRRASPAAGHSARSSRQRQV